MGKVKKKRCFLYKLTPWNLFIITSVVFTICSLNTVVLLNADKEFILENKNLLKNKNKKQKNNKNIEIGTKWLYNKPFPKIEADFEKLKKIEEMFKFAWNGYKKYAWGKDFLNPVTKTGENVFSGGLSIIDSLDTMLLLGLEDEIRESKEWIDNNLKFDGEYSIFEINIRYIGSFLSMYQQTGDIFFLEKAKYVADCLMPAFDKNTGFFRKNAHFRTIGRNTTLTKNNDEEALISDLGAVHLEFYTLSLLTGDEKYAKTASKIHKTIFKTFPGGLIPEWINIENMREHSNYKSFDTMSDSYYEYLIKVYLMSNGTQPKYLKKFLEAISEAKKKMVLKGNENTYLAKLGEKKVIQEMTHLVTFVPEMLALGSIKYNENADEDLKLADKLVSTYYRIYRGQSSGLMPEVFLFQLEDDFIFVTDSQYQLRPETIESLFYMYRFTGLQKYREYAWDIFKAIEKNCKVESGGYSSIVNTNAEEIQFSDKQDSYFLAETIKYLYLIFSDDETLPITQYIFNTEGHPLKVWNEKEAKFMKRIINV